MSTVAVPILGLMIGAILGSLGGGGSVLAVPVLVFVARLPLDEATAISLVAVGSAAVVAAVGHARRGNVRYEAAAQFAVAGIAGSWLGTALHHRLRPEVTLLMFAGLVAIAAHRMVTACPSCTAVGEAQAIEADAPTAGIYVPANAWRPSAKTLIVGAVVGALTGLFGVGGGFVIVPALTLAMGMNMTDAIGTSLAIVFANSLTAIAFRGVGTVDWGAALPFAVAMLVGSALGGRYGRAANPTVALRLFAILLVGVAIATATSAIIDLTT